MQSRSDKDGPGNRTRNTAHLLYARSGAGTSSTSELMFSGHQEAKVSSVTGLPVWGKVSQRD